MTLGLTSVTFRERSSDEILEYSKTCGIQVIEWGSDVHAKPDDLDHLSRIQKQTENAGIRISSYGSYYKLGEERFEESFAQYLEAAKTLGAPLIRIWSGKKSYVDVEEEEYQRCLQETKHICRMAEQYGMEIAFEYHNGTITDTKDHALRLIGDAQCSNLGMYWQYDPKDSMEQNCETLKAFRPFLKMVHVFNMDSSFHRISIGECGGKEMWTRFIHILREQDIEVPMLMEFLPESSVECLKTETDIMRELLQAI